MMESKSGCEGTDHPTAASCGLVSIFLYEPVPNVHLDMGIALL